MLNPPKKIPLGPKTKMMPQWYCRRGTITIKSNPHTHRMGDEQTENSNSKVTQLLWRFWTHIRLPNLGIRQGLGTPWNPSGLWRTADLITGTSNGGNRDLGLGAHQQGLLHTKTQRKGAGPHRRLNQKYHSAGVSPVECGVSRAHHRDGDAKALGQEGPLA